MHFLNKFVLTLSHEMLLARSFSSRPPSSLWSSSWIKDGKNISSLDFTWWRSLLSLFFMKCHCVDDFLQDSSSFWSSSRLKDKKTFLVLLDLLKNSSYCFSRNSIAGNVFCTTPFLFQFVTTKSRKSFLVLIIFGEKVRLTVFYEMQLWRSFSPTPVFFLEFVWTKTRQNRF